MRFTCSRKRPREYFKTKSTSTYFISRIRDTFLWKCCSARILPPFLCGEWERRFRGGAVKKLRGSEDGLIRGELLKHFIHFFLAV